MKKQIIITIGEQDMIIGSKTYGSAPVKIEVTPGMNIAEILQTLTGVLQSKQNELILEVVKLQDAIMNATKGRA